MMVFLSNVMAFEVVRDSLFDSIYTAEPHDCSPTFVSGFFLNVI